MNRDLYIKENVNEHEYEMHRHVYKLNVVKTPKIIAYDRESKVMIMERIPLMNVSDYYGEEEEKVPSAIFTQVRDIVKTLYKNNIIYPDITGYNFLEFIKNVMWVVDFEHAHFKPHLNDTFVEKFIRDPAMNKWNPEFK